MGYKGKRNHEDLDYDKLLTEIQSDDDVKNVIDIGVHKVDEKSVDDILPKNPVLPMLTEVVGVRFHEAGKVYYFASELIPCKIGDKVIVKTAKGLEIGTVAMANKPVPNEELVLPLRSLERLATEDDMKHLELNKQLEKEAFRICKRMIADHKLDMKLIDAKYAFDNSQLLFNFTADKRVDFRELVKDLASCFRTRIELRQIGIRDQAKAMGGLGVCGRPFCCSSFLTDFAQVSIKMAKEQNLSLNSSKISGTCGRLMCCLRYEHEVYEEELKTMPHVDSKVKTPDGVGYVSEISPLIHLVKVRFVDKNETVTVKTYDKKDITVFERKSDKKKAHGDSDDFALEGEDIPL